MASVCSSLPAQVDVGQGQNLPVTGIDVTVTPPSPPAPRAQSLNVVPFQAPYNVHHEVKSHISGARQDTSDTDSGYVSLSTDCADETSVTIAKSGITEPDKVEEHFSPVDRKHIEPLRLQIQGIQCFNLQLYRNTLLPRVNLASLEKVPLVLMDYIINALTKPLLESFAADFPPEDDQTKQQNAGDAGTEASEELVHDWICKLFDEFAEEHLLSTIDDWKDAMLLPPVNFQALQVLDTKKLITDPSLRMELNFMRALNLRTRLPKDQLKEKEERSTEYWDAIAGEIELFRILNGLRSSKRLKLHRDGITLKRIIDTSAKRLPLMFREIKKILVSILPSSDYNLVEDGLQDDIIMAKLKRDSCDIEPTIIWLSKILKAHCSPAQVEPIGEMLALFQESERSNLAEPLCELFKILEGMKLDAVDHEISLLRYQLIQGTTSYLFDFCEKAIASGAVNINEDVRWIQTHHREIHALHTNSDEDGSHAMKPQEVFEHAFMTLLMPSIEWEPVPPSLWLSTQRIMMLRRVILHRIHVDLSYQVFESCHNVATGGEVSISDATKKEVLNRFGLIFDSRNVVKVLPDIAVQIGAELQASTGMDNIESIPFIAEKVKPMLEARLKRDSPQFLALRNAFERQLYLEITSICLRYRRGSAVDLAQKLVPDAFSTPELPRATVARAPPKLPKLPRVPYQDRLYCTYLDATVNDIARSISHFAILHYQIWGPLVYNKAIAEIE